MASPSAKLPRHVAFIMDGNGRWAKARGLPRTEGHRVGVERVRELLESMRDLGIPWVTLYAFSTENWRRPSGEIEVLFDLLCDYLERELADLLANDVRLHVIGDLDGLPERPRRLIADAIERTTHCKRWHLVVALNYGGRDEIVRAVRRWAQDPGAPPPEALDESGFAAYLDTAGMPDPDLVVRTSGEQRLSNFLLWQAAYAEFVFVPAPWPEFDRAALEAVLAEYARRRRRFGATDEQLESEES